jgi:hypothetical protein
MAGDILDIDLASQAFLRDPFTRFPNLSLAVLGSALRYTGRLGIRALRALPVRLT